MNPRYGAAWSAGSDRPIDDATSMTDGSIPSAGAAEGSRGIGGSRDRLTAADREQVQMHFVRRWLDARCRLEGRRKGDKPISSALSQSQRDRYWRWLVEQRRRGMTDR